MAHNEMTYRSRMPVSRAEALAWHSRPGAFERLTPPWMDVRVVDSLGTISPGDWKRLSVPVGPFGVNWTVTHRAGADGAGGFGFLDEQESGPFRSWQHEHRFVPTGASESVLTDRLHLPASWRRGG